jgi:Fic family protein
VFEPRFRITGPIARALMSIEADRQSVIALPLSVRLLDTLRRSARLLSTHLSTQIEGNKLTPTEVRAVIEGGGSFPGRERDEAEVRNYYAALEFVDRLGRTQGRLTESELRTIHGLVMTGRARPTRYRNGQNVIRDSRTGRIVYLPPEAGDVPRLMKDLVRWVNQSVTEGQYPLPIIASLAHYQFATIHPYFDGNGRSARLLTNLLLHRGGYGLHGIYSLEEYYAANLAGYYSGLAVGASHNYYFGRVEADITPFVAYFCAGMANAFADIRRRAADSHRAGQPDQGSRLRDLTPQQRQAIGLFRQSRTVRARDVAAYFRITPRQAYLLCVRWLNAGFLAIADPSTKARSYRLGERYEELITARDIPTGPRSKPDR